MEFSVAAYLNRIQYFGSTEPTVANLRLLHYQHLMHIPFENLDIHTSTPIVLDEGRIFAKIIHRERGGFCYELNGIFYRLLTVLGFNAKRVSARVINKKGIYPPEFDHLAILVEINEHTYLADVGCGEFILEPLLFQLDEVQVDPAGTFVIDSYEDRYRVSKLVDGEKKPEYIFTTIARSLHEFSERCDYQQSDPTSHFMKKRMITKPTENGRISIAGDKLKIRDNQSIEEIILPREEDFHQSLQHYFDITIR